MKERYGAGDNDDVVGLAIRATPKISNLVFDKIMITEISKDTEAYIDNEITLDYNDGVTPNETKVLPYNTQFDLPIPEREGYIFAGWYKNLKRSNHDVAISDISVPSIISRYEFKGTTFKAEWVKKETVKVDFSEDVYELVNSKAEGYASDMGSAFSIKTEEGVDTEEGADNTFAYFNTTSNKKYKIALFRDDETRILVHEGVSYRIKVRYKVVTPANTNIGVCRSEMNGYCPIDLEGTNADSMTNIGSIANATDGFVEAEEIVRAQNIFVAHAGDKAGGNQYARYQLALRINKGTVYVDSVEVEPIDYAPTYVDYDTTKGSVELDYVNKTVTVKPNDGYEVSAMGVKVKMLYREFSFYKNDKGTMMVAVEDIPAEVLAVNNTADGKVFKYNGDYAFNTLGALKVSVEFVSTEDTNANFIAASIRKPEDKGEDVPYVSAGIRFRGRIANDDVVASDEVGFIVMPTKALAGKTIEEYVADPVNGEIWVKGIAKDSTQDKVYQTVGSYKDYQMVLTGLTKKDNADADLRELKLTIAMYFTKGETTEYIQFANSVSYSDFAK